MSTVKVQGNASGTGSITLASPNTNSNQTQTLPDVTGTSLVIDGSGNINNTSGVVNLGSGQVYKDASGNVGIGVTPSAWFSTHRALQVGPVGIFDVGAGASSGGVFVGNNWYLNGSGQNTYITTGVASLYNQVSGQHVWYTAPSGTAGNTISFIQAMTLDASGNLLVGTTNTSASAGSGFKLLPAGNGANSPFIGVVTATSTNTTINYALYSTGASAYRFYVGEGGTVYATSTTISSLSDIRYKENVRDLDVGLAEVMALKPRLYDWKEGRGADTKNARGFIAQEFEQVFPDLIDEWRDPAPEGEEPYKSVRQDLIPVLVKAIQEQQAMIEEMKAEIAALKGATQ